MLIDLLHIFWSYLKQITWLYGTFVGLWAIFGLRVIWRTMILAIMKSESERGGKLGLRLDREWEWNLHRLYKQSLHNMYFDSICFMFATFEEGLMNPFNILKRWSRCHFMACDLRRRRQLFSLALVWQLPSLWLNSFSNSLSRSIYTKYK